MAGSFEDLQAQSREIERIAILHRHEGVFRLGAGAEMDGRAATVAQFQMAGDEVGVEVGEEDVADLQAEFLGVGQVLLDIALRVDDDGGRTGLVSEQIGGVGQAAQVILFQNHGPLHDYQSLTARGVASPISSTAAFEAKRITEPWTKRCSIVLNTVLGPLHGPFLFDAICVS